MNDKSEHMWERLQNTQGLLQFYATNLFNCVSPKLGPRVFVLGISKDAIPPIRVEPEDRIDVELFKDVHALAGSIWKSNPRREWIENERSSHYNYYLHEKRDSIRRAVKRLVEQNAHGKDVTSFVSMPVSLENYEVLAVLQFNKSVYDSFDGVRQNTDTRISFLDSLRTTFLNEVLAQLHDIPTPVNSALADYGMNEALRVSAATFVGSAMQATCGFIPDSPDYFANPFSLFNICDYISSLNYEGGASTGKIIAGDKNNPNFEMRLELATPIGLYEYRKIRKLLETATRDLALYTDGHKILGLGKPKKDHSGKGQSFLSITFGGLHKWRLIHGSKELLVVEYGIPKLPQPKINRNEFDDLLQLTFGNTTPYMLNRMWKVVDTATKQKHGALLIISDDAKGEAERLNNQSIKIRPTALDEPLARNVTSIDGATLLDITGTCHAIGVILDGKAVSSETSGRGARYNSAVRYVEKSEGKCVAVIISEDGMVDLYPILLPRIRRSEIVKHIEELRLISNVNISGESKFYAIMHWLVTHAFYLSLEQCNEINQIKNEWHEKVYKDASAPSAFKDLHPDPKMNDSYFLD